MHTQNTKMLKDELMTSLVISLIMPFAYRAQPNNHYLHRLMVIFLTFAPTFVILTISYEGLFYVAFCATLVTWVRLEHEVFVFFFQEEARALAGPTGERLGGGQGSSCLPAAESTRRPSSTILLRAAPGGLL